MAKNVPADGLGELPAELREYNPADSWVDWQEWSRARASAMFRLGVRRLPALQAMVNR